VKLTLAKICSARIDRPQAGFAMPLALGMGLIAIIIAASTIGRSQSDRTTTVSQREQNRALSVAEAGAIRFQSFLDRHKLLATKSLAQWTTTLDSLPPVQSSCHSIEIVAARQQANLFQTSTWIALDTSEARKGRYRVVNYQYQNGIGKLTIAAEMSAYNNPQNISKYSLVVDVPIGSESAGISPPALWANTFNLSTAQPITGQIRGVTCPQLPNVDLDGITGVDAANIALVSGVPSGRVIADPFTSIPAPKVAPTNAILLPAITSSIQLPRVGTGDLPDANREYHYLVDIDNLASGHSIKLQDVDRITIDVAASDKVNLYLKGNIDLAGSQTVNVNAAHPNLRIYGSAQTIRLIVKDNAAITAFIHAPSADAASVRDLTPNPNPAITGAVWVKSWDSMTSPNQLPIIQAGTWADFGISKPEQPAQLSPISYWRRVEN
jgi:hypothetical protein